MMVKDFY